MAKRKYSALSTLYNKEKYLLLGNGINRLEQSGFSWDQLLENVCSSAKLTTEKRGKLYSLFFEEISYTMNPDAEVEENISALKKSIALDAIKLSPNLTLQRLIAKNHYDHFLTTNYDYCIEKAIDATCMSKLIRNDKRSSKYSLYRYNNVHDIKVWHIHGEADSGRKTNNHASILIGFEHYSDYLNKIHQLVKSNDGKGLREQMEQAKENWVHKFFTNDIDMLGFGLDFTETHLWFLLNFRARLLRKKVSIKNKIRWLIGSFQQSNTLDKIELLQALHVDIVVLDATDYQDFYNKLIDTL